MNAYVLYPMRSREQIDDVPYANESRDPLKQYFLLSLLRSDWLRPEVALYTTYFYRICKYECFTKFRNRLNSY